MSATITEQVTTTYQKACCPCCRRNFQNLQRHMKTQHPGYTKH